MTECRGFKPEAVTDVVLCGCWLSVPSLALLSSFSWILRRLSSELRMLYLTQSLTHIYHIGLSELISGV